MLQLLRLVAAITSVAITAVNAVDAKAVAVGDVKVVAAKALASVVVEIVAAVVVAAVALVFKVIFGAAYNNKKIVFTNFSRLLLLLHVCFLHKQATLGEL